MPQQGGQFGLALRLHEQPFPDVALRAGQFLRVAIPQDFRQGGIAADEPPLGGKLENPLDGVFEDAPVFGQGLVELLRTIDDALLQPLLVPSQLILEAHALGYFPMELEIPLLQPLLKEAEREVRLHPGQNLRLLEGLGDVVDAAGLEPPQLVAHGVEGADEDHRDAAGALVRLQPAADLITVQVRHSHIQEHQIGLRCGS